MGGAHCEPNVSAGRACPHTEFKHHYERYKYEFLMNKEFFFSVIYNVINPIAKKKNCFLREFFDSN